MFIIHYSQSTIHNSLFTIHYLHRGSLSNSETIVDETSFYIMKTIYYLQSTIYYLQFTIHYLHCRSLYRSHSTLPIKLLNSSLSSRFLALKFFREKGITDVIQDHMHSYMTGTSCIYNRCICIPPPGRGEGDRNRGLTQGDGKQGPGGPRERRPVKRKRSRPGGVLK